MSTVAGVTVGTITVGTAPAGTGADMHIGGDLVGAEVRASAVGDSEEVVAATGATWVVVAMGAIWAAVEVLAVPDSVWAEEVEAAGAVPQWAAEGVDLGVAVEQRWAAVVEAVAAEQR